MLNLGNFEKWFAKSFGWKKFTKMSKIFENIKLCLPFLLKYKNLSVVFSKIICYNIRAVKSFLKIDYNF